jgi:hypothetical protein
MAMETKITVYVTLSAEDPVSTRGLAYEIETARDDGPEARWIKFTTRDQSPRGLVWPFSVVIPHNLLPDSVSAPVRTYLIDAKAEVKFVGINGRGFRLDESIERRASYGLRLYVQPESRPG